MATLNPTALQRLANFFSTRWTFGKKQVGEYDRFYGEEIPDFTPDLSGEEPMELDLSLRMFRVGEVTTDRDEKTTLGAGDSPRFAADTLKDKSPELEAVELETPTPTMVEKKKSKSSFRRFISRAFGRSGKADKKTKVYKMMDFEENAHGDHLKNEGVSLKNEGISLKFGQLLLDLSVEEFLKIKPKNVFNVPLIIVTPPPEDGVPEFML